MRRIVIVFLGGGIGASLRALIVQAMHSLSGPFPLPVLLVNLVGAFVLGAVYVLADEVELLRTETRLFLAVGVLGGFTTFSTFGWGTDVLLARHDTVAALTYVVASVAGGVLAMVLGVFTGRELVAQLERAARHILSTLADGAEIPAARTDREESA